MPVSFNQNSLHLTFNHTNVWLKKCGTQIWLCLFMFQLITFERLNSLTATVRVFPVI